MLLSSPMRNQLSIHQLVAIRAAPGDDWLGEVVALAKVIAVAESLVDQHPVFRVGDVSDGVAAVDTGDVAVGIRQGIDFRFLHFHGGSSLQVCGCIAFYLVCN